MNHVGEKNPRELVVIAVDNPCTPIYGLVFIWTSMINYMQVRRKQKYCAGTNKEEVECSRM